MAFGYHDITIVYSVACAVSVFLLGLRVAQQLGIGGRIHSQLKRSEIFGTIFFTVSTVFLITMFALRQIDIVGRDKSNGRTYIEGGREVTYGLLWAVNHRNMTEALLAPASLWIIKASYLATFWGVADVLRPAMRKALLGISVYMALTYIVVLFVDLLWCRPLTSVWRFDGAYTRCFTIGFWDVIPFNVKFAMTISTDISIVLFSLFLVRSLRTQKKNELWALGIVFAIGCMSIVACILRYIYTHLLVTRSDSPEALQYSLLFTFWQVMEIMCATVAYGLTSCRVQVRRFWKTISKAGTHLTSFSGDSGFRKGPRSVNPIDTNVTETGFTMGTQVEKGTSEKEIHRYDEHSL